MFNLIKNLFVKKYKLYYFGGKKNKNAGDVFNVDLMKHFNINYSRTRDVNKANLLCVGSNLEKIINKARFSDKTVVIAGAGFISPACGEEKYKGKLEVLALRGELSKQRIERITGMKLDNCVLADPGILISKIYPMSPVKKYKLGIIPHYADKQNGLNINLPAEEYKIIDIQQDAKSVAKEICECECILSSSLHGLIFADSYGIPNRQIILSNNIAGGDYKFKDYYSAFGMELPEPIDLRFKKISLDLVENIIANYPDMKNTIKNMQEKLSDIFERL